MSWWRRLGVRLAATVVLGAAAAITLFAWLVLHAQESFLIGRVSYGAGLLSDTIKNATYHAMLEDRRGDAYLAMENIGAQAGIERVRFFNKEGRITFSTDKAERESYVDKSAEACYACHAADRPLERLAVPSRSRLYPHNHHRVLGMVTPIYNEPSCSNAACHAHPPDKTVLGVLDIGISLQPVDESLAELRRQTLVISGASVLLLAAIVTWFAHRSVVTPVQDLLEATKRIAAGDLSQPVSVRDTTELGQLQVSFNEMGVALGAARQERDALLASLERKVEDRTAALRKAQDQLVRSEKLSSLGRLAASVAHEINNPLAGILTYAKLLLRTMEPGAAADPEKTTAVKYLSLVKRETERCSAIVRNLLDFARERPLKLVEVELAAVVEDALVLLSNQARLQNVVFEKALPKVSPIYGDFGQLRQACINVIINACDAMKDGGTLRISVTEERDEVLLSFADSGVGIPPEYLAKVLDPFFTTKEKGTGLGLSVVYGIIERHGGGEHLPVRLTAADLGTGAARTGPHAS